MSEVLSIFARTLILIDKEILASLCARRDYSVRLWKLLQDIGTESVGLTLTLKCSINLLSVECGELY